MGNLLDKWLGMDPPRAPDPLPLPGPAPVKKVKPVEERRARAGMTAEAGGVADFESDYDLLGRGSLNAVKRRGASRALLGD